MHKATSWMVATCCLVALRLAMALGPIDPPPGSIAPTFHTLSEIYDRVDALGRQQSCPCGPWTSAVTAHATTAMTPVATGSGVLHAIVLPEGRQLQLYSDNGTKLVADVRCTEHQNTISVTLDIAFANGLAYRASPSGYETSECTVLFKTE